MPSASFSRMNFTAVLIRLTLKEPHRPRSAVINTNPTRVTSAAGVKKGWISGSTRPAIFPSIMAKAWAYGRNPSMRCWAPRNLAAETMFMALVICWVFLTAPILRLISCRVAMLIPRP